MTNYNKEYAQLAIFKELKEHLRERTYIKVANIVHSKKIITINYLKMFYSLQRITEDTNVTKKG